MRDPRDIFYKEVSTLQQLAECGLLEIAYKGNVGLHELVQFYNLATPSETDKLELLLKTNRISEAWDLIQLVTHTKLIDVPTFTSQPQQMPAATGG